MVRSPFPYALLRTLTQHHIYCKLFAATKGDCSMAQSEAVNDVRVRALALRLSEFASEKFINEVFGDDDSIYANDIVRLSRTLLLYNTIREEDMTVEGLVSLILRKPDALKILGGPQSL